VSREELWDRVVAIYYVELLGLCYKRSVLEPPAAFLMCALRISRKNIATRWENVTFSLCVRISPPVGGGGPVR